MEFRHGHAGFQIVQFLVRALNFGCADDHAVHEKCEDAEYHEKGRPLEHTVEPTFHITGEQRGDGNDVQQGEPDDQ